MALYIRTPTYRTQTDPHTHTLKENNHMFVSCWTGVLSVPCVVLTRLYWIRKTLGKYEKTRNSYMSRRVQQSSDPFSEGSFEENMLFPRYR